MRSFEKFIRYRESFSHEIHLDSIAKQGFADIQCEYTFISGYEIANLSLWSGWNLNRFEDEGVNPVLSQVESAHLVRQCCICWASDDVSTTKTATPKYRIAGSFSVARCDPSELQGWERIQAPSTKTLVSDLGIA